MLSRFSQAPNAFGAILSTLRGKFTLVNPAHQNAYSPIFVTPSGIVTLVSLLHPRKASFPMLIKPSAIVTVFNFLQNSNALSSIFVIGKSLYLSMTKSVIVSSSVPSNV